MRNFIFLLLGGLALSVANGVEGERAIYLSGNQTFVGCIYKPSGPGPFPAVIFNQGTVHSLVKSGRLDPFPALAKLYTSKGYVLFAPGRFKLTDNDDENTQSENETSPGESGSEKYKKFWSNHELHTKNIVAATQWLKTQAYVDEKRIVMTGAGAGAIDGLLAAEKDLDLRGLVVFSPAAGIWKQYPILQRRLKSVVRESLVPIFLIQPENDFDRTPAAVLGLELGKKEKPNRVKIYPPFGSTVKEASTFAVQGSEVWGKDVLSFLDKVLK